MDSLQKTLFEGLLDAPYHKLAKIIADKLASQGVTLSTREEQRLIDHLKINTTDPFKFRNWQWWSNKNFDVHLSEDEVEEIHEWFTEFLNNKLPELLHSMVEELSAEILITLNKNWAAESRRQKREISGFLKRLNQRWGKGIDLLRMFIAISREFGESINNSLSDNENFISWNLLEALSRLHARSCQVAEEIVCLISAGFADGAMARWRTLHEIAIVALLLQKHGEDLAKHYIDHQVVESFRAACDYQECYERLDYEPMPASEFEAVYKEFEAVTQKYGTSFKDQYGWAAKALNIKKPTLRDIEKDAGIDHLRAHYRMASHNVHSNPKGVYFKLGLIGEIDILLAGPSNTGFTDPGHSTAISLMQVSAAFGLIQPNLDSLVSMKILSRLVEEIGEAFYEAQQSLENDMNLIPNSEANMNFNRS